MKIRNICKVSVMVYALTIGYIQIALANNIDSESVVYKSGHSSLQHWLMPDPPHPKDNKPTTARVELGKKLFFDPRLSSDGNMSCATCHSPLFGWSDGLPTAKGFKSKTLGRSSPTIINTAYQSLQMWDGRKKTLEEQALGPMVSSDEMNIGIEKAIKAISKNKEYKRLFSKAYPEQKINEVTLAKAIASFERTIISTNSRFDKWIKGDKKALNKSEIRGFKVFNEADKGNCTVCHSAPNFTDNGFHNIGLEAYGKENPDMGRYAIKPIKILKGAFKTPTLREASHTAPYFHDGSSKTLKDVIDHYISGGIVKTNISPSMKKLALTEQEKNDLLAFLNALSNVEKPFLLPTLPK